MTDLEIYQAARIEALEKALSIAKKELEHIRCVTVEAARDIEVVLSTLEISKN